MLISILNNQYGQKYFVFSLSLGFRIKENPKPIKKDSINLHITLMLISILNNQYGQKYFVFSLSLGFRIKENCRQFIAV